MDNREFVKIKCPECGAVLTVQYAKGIEQKSVRCPVCKIVHPYKDYKPYQTREVEDKTEYEQKAVLPGSLTDTTNGKCYQLNVGVNTIGRKAASSNASLQIDTSDRYMSRVHIEIRFDGSFHFLRVLTDKNQTLVNGQSLLKDEEIILQGGEVLTLAYTDLRFESHEIENQDDKTVY